MIPIASLSGVGGISDRQSLWRDLRTASDLPALLLFFSPILYCKGKIRTTPLAVSFWQLSALLPRNTRVLLRHLHENLSQKYPRQRCKAIKSGKMCVSDKAKGAGRARWHGQAFQHSMSVQFPLLIGFALLPYSIPALCGYGKQCIVRFWTIIDIIRPHAFLFLRN